MIDDDLLRELIEESIDHLDQIEPLLLVWESDPGTVPQEEVNDAFRSLHTIKGGFGFFSYEKIQGLAHTMEALLMAVRDGELLMTAGMVRQLINSCDVLRELVEDPDLSHDRDLTAIITALESHRQASADVAQVDDQQSRLPVVPEEVADKVAACQDDGQLVFVINLSVAQLQKSKRSVDDFQRDLQAYGTILHFAVADSDEPTSQPDDQVGNDVSVVLATLFPGEALPDALGIEAEQLMEWRHADDCGLIPTPATAPVHAAALEHVPMVTATSEAPVAEPVAAPIAALVPDENSTSDTDEALSSALPAAIIAASKSSLGNKDTDTEDQADTEKSGGNIATSSRQTSTGRRTSSSFAGKDVIKVKVDLIDRLMTLGGELVLNRNRMRLMFEQRLTAGNLGQILGTRINEALYEVCDELVDATERHGGDLREALNRSLPDLRAIMLEAAAISLDESTEMRTAIKDFDSVTTAMQGAIMQTRMQPVGVMFSKFPRIVRDLADKLDRRIDFVTDGNEVELDKTIIDAIVDPLTHLIRNAIDHGIEPPDVRDLYDKSETGHLTLRAIHASGFVRIEIIDDGRGMDADALRDKAVERGLLNREAARNLSDAAALELVLLPGFSTAARVSEISGRGVGMDVVKTNIERIGGTIGINSELGQGTTFTLQIPLTLAIIPALVVCSGGHRYALPQANLDEIVRVGPHQRIEELCGSKVLRLRGELIPVLSLVDTLELSAVGEERSVLVIRTQSRPFGVLVEAIEDSVEIVVRPISKRLRSNQTLAGATILGDGTACLILDILSLADRAGLRFEGLIDDSDEDVDVADEKTDRQIMISGAPDGGQQALFMDSVIRLETLPAADVQDVGGRSMIRYRGAILHLIEVSQVLPERRTEERAVEWKRPSLLTTVIARVGDGQIGLVVDEILDVVDLPNERTRPSRDGIGFCSLIEDRIVEVLDLGALMRLAGLTDVAAQYHLGDR